MHRWKTDGPTRVLLGVKAPSSPATSYALRLMGELLEPLSPRLHVICLAVIPASPLASPRVKRWRGAFRPWSPTSEQRTEAEQAIQQARSILQQQGVAAGCSEGLIRVGKPADELVRAAAERQVACIVLGSRGNTVGQHVLGHASCPVLIAPQPQQAIPHDLVAWYERAITCDLREQFTALLILTPQEVVHQFVPPETNIAEGSAGQAAALALEHLVRLGFLSRHIVNGQVRYVND